MSMQYIGNQHRARRGQKFNTGGFLGYGAFIKSLFAGNIIQYLQLDEYSGGIAVDSSGRENPGAYSNVLLSNALAPLGVGGIAPLFNGTTSYVDLYSPDFNTDFSTMAFSLLAAVKVSALGIWTDGAEHRIATLASLAGSGNQIYIRKATNDGRVSGVAQLGGVTKFVHVNGLSFTDWFFVGLTVDTAADELKFYINGLQQGLTQTGLGTWDGGDLNTAYCVFGAGNTAPITVWDGWGCQSIVLNRAATPAEVLSVAQAGGV